LKNIQRLISRGTEIAASQLILVDTKYEFGKTKEGVIVLIDEIHTLILLAIFIQKDIRKGRIRRRAKAIV
jgi:isoprenylcysteine carboxyl methyltransferase (ICMT) family protein YpbQ